MILVSLIHSLKELYPYLEIIRLIKALYEQRLHEIIEPKIFKNHYNHYFRCLTVETKEDDEKLASSEEYKVYIEYFWKLFQWIKIELVEGHAFDILGDYSHDEFEESLLNDIKSINEEIKYIDVNLVYNENKPKVVEKEKEKNSSDDRFMVNVDEKNNLNVKEIKNKIHAQNVKLVSKDDSYTDNFQLKKSNLFVNMFCSVKIDELDYELYYKRFDLIFRKIFYYEIPMTISINDVYHLDKPPPSESLHRYN